MSLQILDGKGSGSLMEIKGNRAQVDSDSHSSLQAHSELGDAYAWTNVTYNYTAADTIVGLRNTSSDNNLHIDKIFLSGDTATIVQLHIVSGSAALAGTAITGVNLNQTSGNVADADAVGDETTNSSQGILIFSPEILAATMLSLDFNGSLILGTNDMLGIDYVTVGAIVHVTIMGFYD